MGNKGVAALRIFNHGVLLLTITALLSSCQSAPRVPEVIGKVPVQVIGDIGAMVTNAQTGYIYFARGNYLTILKGAEIVREAKTMGQNVASMAIDEMNDLVYVVSEYSDNVTVIHGTDVIGVIQTVSHRPRGVAVESKSRYAYVVSGHRNVPPNEDPVESNILVLNGTQVIENLKVSGRVLLREVVADSIGGHIYAGGSTDIVVFKGLQEVARHKIPSLDGISHSLDINPRTGEVYAFAAKKLYRFKDGKLVDSVNLNPNMGNVWEIRVQPATGAVYISHNGYARDQGHILVVREMQVIGEIKVGGLSSLAVDPLTGNVYAADFGSYSETVVTVINGTQVLGTIKVGGMPYKIDVNPTNGWVYVSNTQGGTVTVLGYPDDKRGSNTALPIFPTISLTPSKPYP